MLAPCLLHPEWLFANDVSLICQTIYANMILQMETVTPQWIFGDSGKMLSLRLLYWIRSGSMLYNQSQLYTHKNKLHLILSNFPMLLSTQLINSFKSKKNYLKKSVTNVILLLKLQRAKHCTCKLIICFIVGCGLTHVWCTSAMTSGQQWSSMAQVIDLFAESIQCWFWWVNEHIFSLSQSSCWLLLLLWN